MNSFWVAQLVGFEIGSEAKTETNQTEKKTVLSETFTAFQTAHWLSLLQTKSAYFWFTHITASHVFY